MTVSPSLPPPAASTAGNKPIKQVITREDWIMRGALILAVIWLTVGVILPLFPMVLRSLQDTDGAWVGFDNYLKYLTTPSLLASFGNSLYVAFLTTLVSVSLAFVYAYALTRTAMPGKGVFRLLSLLPLYIPPLAHAIGLIYLFGNQGLVTQVGWDINLYGPTGIVMGEFFYCFPQAVVILTTALSLTDARLYEAAQALRTSPIRTFFTVTLPGVKFGLISSIFVCFILAFTDFGVPKVVGGDFNVLATDIYKQVIGQQNFSMGATISVFLLVPAVLAFVLDRMIQRRQTALVSAKAVPLQPKPQPVLDWMMFACCTLIASAAIIVFGTIIFASLVKVWPYDFSLSLRNYDFSRVGGGGYRAYWNSIRMSFYTAVLGTALVFTIAYLVEKGRGMKWLRNVTYFLSTIPLALPGLVLGLAYVFFFNQRTISIPFTGYALLNPLNGLYSTMGILVLCTIIHFSTVCFLTASTALKQLDPEFEAVSASLSVPFYKTFWRVTVPMCLPAILEIGIYYFINAMVTVSAVIFLYPPKLPLASVAIVNMDDAGDVSAAAAMSVLIVLTSLGVKGIYWLLTRGLQQRTQAWLKK
ncbi:putative 2-aminoethylphosphonate ABC transporter permease subunit [Leptolyngbyaceae cyanobacterium CCMR0082]|uniref:Putative 2-aminoethylphosphonate ABC transporter permease subunit n=3 Tax=Adonisia turfae TaxID=2950184 RepID=A0A6M0S802_9CYAN|nr:putative 2-aminoethylphosphonate ABC transporter permease subunit [Adonisia turfae]NEZ64549.1 putative 2-aminoethylphosphonate ABC transporter permease subunit [Adonisia turfae CCMR0082]